MNNLLHKKLYAAVLRAHGYNPIEVADERTAVEAAARLQPIAAIIDILLPSVDGRVIIAQLRQDTRTCDIPILAVSAAAIENIAKTCYSAGADRFHAKPVPMSAIVSDIIELSDQAKVSSLT
ncbi:response regulator [Sphingobium sp. BS19]|uniref:response regulator n=1 Tax=Sphingobium sp. BS19 TaxID=3018973 RepID=UPI0022EED3EC|nr:response regulator [Sphingobium sp. BS19]GLI97039.1 hypothetical protein Sbs19_08570 [Sphingobium sp. BS19]